MPFRIAAHSTGPLAALADTIDLPACLSIQSDEQTHQLWTLTDPDRPEEPAYVLLPDSPEKPQPSLRLRTVNDWLPGMTVLYQRNRRLRGSARAEVSALWTSLMSPAKNLLRGDVGLDLDLGLQTAADWQAEAHCWWSLERPRDPGAAVLRLRLARANTKARSIRVTARAVAGAGQATRQTLAALTSRHRSQILREMSQGIYRWVDKASFLNHATGLDVQAHGAEAESRFAQWLEQWLALDGAAQSLRWQQAADPFVQALQAALGKAGDIAMDAADQLTARLEHAALQSIEQRCHASLTATFCRGSETETLLDAEFDFASGNPRLEAILDQALDGDIDALLERQEPGLRLHRGALTEQLSRRATFTWRLPWSNGSVSTEERITTAIQALDTELGRVVKGSVKSEIERRTRKAASLLTLEASLASLFTPDLAIHNPASLQARFEMVIRTNRPASLQPLLDLYRCGVAEPGARECRLEVTVPPEALQQWLEPQSQYDVARRMQAAWRALLVSSTDIYELGETASAPLLVWSALPVTAGARRTERGIELQRNDDIYWDWRDPRLLEAMIWNARTQAALEQRLAHLPQWEGDADSLRRALHNPVARAVLNSLLFTEACLIDRFTGLMLRLNKCRFARQRSASEAMHDCSYTLRGLTKAMHTKLISVYGPETARALGPLLLCASPRIQPVARVSWSR